MNKYETVMIINNEITKEQRNNVIARVKEYIFKKNSRIRMWEIEYK